MQTIGLKLHKILINKCQQNKTVRKRRQETKIKNKKNIMR